MRPYNLNNFKTLYASGIYDFYCNRLTRCKGQRNSSAEGFNLVFVYFGFQVLWPKLPSLLLLRPLVENT